MRPTKPQPTDMVAALRSLRWPIAGVVGLLFALVRLVETSLIGFRPLDPLFETLEALFWGALAAVAIYAVLSWAAHQEQRRQVAEASFLDELRLTNARLELLYELNQRIASSDTLDDVLDYAITLPARLFAARAAALVLYGEQGRTLTARCLGLNEEQLAAARSAFGLAYHYELPPEPTILKPRGRTPAGIVACLILPLAERDNQPLGWIEGYLTTTDQLTLEQPSARSDQVLPLLLSAESTALLLTVAGELTESIQGSRRRARELASVATLEQAITEERTRIARDLHDGVAQSLAFLRMRVDLWADWLHQDPQRLSGEFVNLKANLRQQIDELRRAIFALRPMELGQLGFVAALRRYVSEFAEQQAWELELELSDLPTDIPQVLELAAFRFAQEGLNNAAKHAHASHVALTIRTLDGGLQIVVRDNGIGFDPGAQGERPGTRLGLRQLRERATALDGRLTILSRPGQGTELRVWLPLRYAAEDRIGKTL
ncbi:sensor histidine kinase [Candidatus Viridilinea mediisalina]|uniref:Oxygen sensor histidine kinase NreB n=1 Tax=Candidatus Viridilinea mediisalina TaxID=2024553 RepID=A0A2A6RP03_9CHLR|nr:sensor histidine kinase [Candidatus Viridilinea mediisalina]PDW04792.1 sensor histidine kinase [Candidatus Viridilinea mediisalina]